MSDRTNDVVAKIVEANALENSGDLDAAIALYREIIELDRGGNYGNVAQQALDNLQPNTTDTITSEPIAETTGKQSAKSNWWSRLSIKAKTNFILVGVALASTVGISTTAYILADETVSQEINRAQRLESYTVTKEIALFMRDRLGDIQIMSGMELIANPDLRASSNALQKKASLNNYAEAYGIYNAITAYDRNGEPIASSATVVNPRDRDYFQRVLTYNRPYVSQPTISERSNELVVYLAAPIKDTQSGYTIGVMVAEMPLTAIEELIDLPEESIEFYLLDNQGQILLSSDAENSQIIGNDEASEAYFDFYGQLKSELNRRNSQRTPSAAGRQKKVAQQSAFYGEQEVGYITTFQDFEADFRETLPDLGWSTLLTIDNDIAFATQKRLLQVFIIGSLVASLAVAALSNAIANRATRPVVEAADAVRRIGRGDLDVNLQVRGQDELADLSSNINKMAEQIANLIAVREQEAQRQRQEKDLLQQGVMGLLLDVEGAQKGDLTVKAEMTDGAIGSVADAFNATISKLRELLQQVQKVSSEVGQLSLSGEQSVRQLSESAIAQTEEIDRALSSIDEIDRSVKTVADYAQEAAKIARNGSIQAKEGDLAMDSTVDSIEKIRHTVASTSKKVKQLAESSQEIAQIVEIISGISEKTNLLAFNASVEAARAGEHGEGFRIVAEEVRRLADRTTDATKGIQQLVSTIQQDTTTVLQSMEVSTSEVVNGSELIRMTKANLKSLAQTNQQIDEYLKYISTSTNDQTNTSQEVNQKISGLATLAKSNSTQAQNVVQSLRTLVSEADNLQTSISQFKLKSEETDLEVENIALAID